MALRCLLFSSDEGTTAPILQVLAGLGVEGEHCSDAVVTVDKVTHQNFQIVIIDWDKQPEAALLLTASRERKAAERPLTLAIVSDDVSVPQALQAGANSILRKPIMVSQVKDTLATARDLLRSKQESAATAVQASAAAASAVSASSSAVSPERAQERTLRAGEFLQSAPPAPGGQFVTEAAAHGTLEPSSVEPIDPLKDLEPMAASVAHEKPAPAPTPAPAQAPPPSSSEPRGLEWYLKTRGGTLSPTPVSAPAPPAGNPELLGFDQTPSYSAAPSDSARASAPEARPHQQGFSEHKQDQRNDQKHEQKQEQKREAQLFAYMAGESSASEESPRPRFRLGKGAIITALTLATCAIVAAPQAPWHPRMQAAWAHGQQTMRGWLNPQPVTPVQTVAHEDFGRAGDEYKLPVAENIPDATTDPSQIRVVPLIDPTAKKPATDGTNAEQPPAQVDPAATNPSDQTPSSGTEAPEHQVLENHVPETQPPQSTPATVTPVSGSPSASITPSTTSAPAASLPPHSDSPVSSPVSAPPRPAPPKKQETNYTPGNVPSSLKSQLASMTPDAGGNKPVESAMPSIEPVDVPEAAERALLTAQPALAYPANARGQQGTVVLQVLIGRDGAVRDAKFLQGSLAFARTAIDGVKLWKFKPYSMNGRPVSVQTLLTITFKP